MKLAIMQPYLFPYLPYFQLVHAVDKFVNYDDVSFIKKGWINRNTLLSHGEPILFSIPISDMSSFRPINETKLNIRQFGVWRKKLFKTIHLNYNKAPYYSQVIELVEKVLFEETEYISEIAFNSIKEVCAFLDIETTLIETSRNYNNNNLSGKDRVLDICKFENSKVYINPIGGQDLYSKDDFEENGISLYFLKAKEIRYQQFFKEFVPNLSVIDVLMHNSKAEVNDLLNMYDLI